MDKSNSDEHTWAGRNLENYKKTHRELAEKKGVLREFLAAKTVTQAKKVLFG